MNIYLRKKRWKLFLVAFAVVIVAASLWYTNLLVEHIRKDERKNVQIWADAIHQKADLVNFTNDLFDQLKVEERKRVSIVAEAQRRIITATSNEDLNFFLSIIGENTTIPVIVTDEKGTIMTSRNANLPDSVKTLSGELKKEYSAYPPIVVNYIYHSKIYLYYKDSNVFSSLKAVMTDLIRSFFSEVVLNSASVPVIITDSTGHVPFDYGNIPKEKMKDSVWVSQTLQRMASQNTPIKIDLADTGIHYIYYQDSWLLLQLRYYPFVQFGVITVFLLIAYLLFSYARKSEQNQVWVGMAKETAHQLGTPLSSMVAWMELLKLKGLDEETIREIEKDVQRLETITERFSKIGSAARLEKTNIVAVVHETISYLRLRLPAKVTFEISPGPEQEIVIPLNLHLFEWVVENICKNAVDAMDGSGSVRIEITEDTDHIHVDISDTGKGIPKSLFKTVFRPGYTSKKRGWGLGLTLTKRIIENYHSGKIFVKSSVVNKGTTFRIILKK
ncbi:MAG TPA: HAMP domain-containing sensor histidine kinase [Bacteroidales bacterium]|nr:HAMP domain-containing sensor histidine kinase [Bacteroidales bacterium]